MIDLRILNLENNNIQGSIPPTFGLFTNMQELNLSQNKLKGTVPDSIGNMTDLKKLKLHSNRFQGKLPKNFSKLQKLHRLELHRNYKLTGPIDMLGHLKNLRCLKVNENKVGSST